MSGTATKRKAETVRLAAAAQGTALGELKESPASGRPQGSAEPTVFLVDEDESFRQSIEGWLRSVGFNVCSCRSAEQFLQMPRPEGPMCVVLEVCLPGLSGLELQQVLAGSPSQAPLIFLTGHGDIALSVRAMKAGAVEFLTKPCRAQDLLAAIEQALRQSQAMRQQRARLSELRARYQALTPCERQVMARVVAGLLNKQIAADLGTTEKTVKFHRAHVMRKMGVESLAQLVQMAVQLERARSDGP